MRHWFFFIFITVFFIEAKAQTAIEKFIYEPEATQQSQLFFMRGFADGSGFAIVTTSSNTNVWRIQARSFDAYGNERWNNILSMQIPGTVTSVNVTSGGGLLIGGYGYDENGNNACLIISIDNNGKVLWQKMYLPNGNSSGIYSISENSFGEILAYGFYSRIGGGSGGHFIMRTKADGNVISFNSLYNTGLWGQGFPAKDGGLYINSHEGAQKYNAKGELEWIRSQAEGFTRSTHAAVDNDNNFYCISGSGTTYILTKFSAAGKSLWHKKLDFYFSKFCMANNKLIFVNIGESTAYVFNTDGEFIQSAKYNYPYEAITGAGTNRYWLAGRHKVDDNIGLVLARTGNGLTSSCASLADMAVMTEGTYHFAPRTAQLSGMGYEVKSFNANVNPAISNTDTLCFFIEPLKVNLGNDTTLCLGENMVLDAGNEGSEYIWNTGETTQKIRVTASGTYKVMVKNAFGETGEDSINISFQPKPEIAWHFNKTFADPGEKIMLLDESSTAYKRLWILPDGDTSSQQKLEYVIPENGEYKFTLRLTNTSGCSNQITKTVKIAYYRLYFPNAFSPNDDELNEIFAPNGYGVISYRLKLYNRWGELVFDGENKGWDGKFRNKLAAEGMYFYKAEIFNVQQKHEYLSGNVYLVK